MISRNELPPVTAYFVNVPDPRSDINKLYPLYEVIVITILAVISFATGWEGIEEYANAKRRWLEKFIPELKNGVPHHDVYRRVFGALDSKVIEKCFMNWVRDIKKTKAGEVIAIDGKSIRGTFNAETGKCVHIVSAWACANKLVFGQVKTDEHSNEITAIPTLLEQICLEGAVVTIDAMGCQYEIADQIVRKKGDYLFSLKGNQTNLHKDIVEYFARLDFDKPAKAAGPITFKTTVTFDDKHGRHEEREIAVSDDVEMFHKMYPKWKSMNTFGIVESTVTEKGKTTVERRHFISSLSAADPKRFAEVVRAHWGIENSLHYVLDVDYGEDRCRVRKDNGPENLNIIRKIGLTLAKADKKSKMSLIGRKRMMAWGDEYMEKVLFDTDFGVEEAK
jgi:predicted transposase YbfD/YdcC